MGYDDIRAALGRGFSVTTLNEVARLGHDLLGADTPLRHPAAAYALAVTAQKIAWLWEGQPVREDGAAVVEAHIKPKMFAVLDVAESDASALMVALDELASAYADAKPLL